MKIRIVLTAVFCLLLGIMAVSAQEKKANFAGNWELDTAKSKLPEMMRIESMTMNVSQTDTELTVETKTKRAERPEGAGNGGGMRGGGGGGGRGMGRGGGMMGGDNSFTYTLDGKETSAAAAGAMGETKLKAKFEKEGKLKLTQTRSFETQMGSVNVKIADTWELQDDGKTLKVVRDMETPRGTMTSEMYFTKKE